MKTATQVIFASALMLSVVAPSLSHAQGVMNKDKAATQQVPRDIFEFYGSGNTSVPGIGFDKDDSRYQKSR
jgi:hypothetical protein